MYSVPKIETNAELDEADHFSISFDQVPYKVVCNIRCTYVRCTQGQGLQIMLGFDPSLVPASPSLPPPGKSFQKGISIDDAPSKLFVARSTPYLLVIYPGQLAVRGSLSAFVIQPFNSVSRLSSVRLFPSTKYLHLPRLWKRSRHLGASETFGRYTPPGEPPRASNQIDMQSPYLQAMMALRTSSRRSSTSSQVSSGRSSYRSVASSQARTVNSIIFRQPSILGMEEERNKFGSDLDILEPRPIVYWGGWAIGSLFRVEAADPFIIYGGVRSFGTTYCTSLDRWGLVIISGRMPDFFEPIYSAPEVVETKLRGMPNHVRCDKEYGSERTWNDVEVLGALESEEGGTGNVSSSLTIADINNTCHCPIAVSFIERRMIES
ncbi:hypothetical protein ACRALDRAFT_210649 [Sodiomyces alcalophilus JCM 7366]|uniref:uncharacterized protein n=1 Tax=Sodiomyces alcalophilus JCM 7366 TaxID=591952 RepID=UPI0039B4A1CE